MRKMNTKTLVTTQSPVFDSFMCKLMFNFLDENYPITKIKHKKRFKRGINIDGKEFTLPNDNAMVALEIFSTLKAFYGTQDSDIKRVILEYYNIG